MTAPVRPAELLIVTLARLLEGAGHVAVGALSPIPGSAALLMRARSGNETRVSVLDSSRNFWSDGSKELFDCAAQGRIDAFFLGGTEIDGEGNINLVAKGGYPKPQVRYAGSWGSAYLYFLVPKVILFREEHSPKTLVRKVEFVSSPGVSAPNVYRPGGPSALVTGRAVFSFARQHARFRLESVHPGESVESVRAATGFDFDADADIAETEAPNADTLALLRGPVAHEIAETYPRFAAREFLPDGAEKASIP